MRKPEDTQLTGSHADIIIMDDVSAPSSMLENFNAYTGTGHIRVFSGRGVDPYSLQEIDIDPADCIHAISQINRFTGHALRPYSVGEHTINLCNAVPQHLKKAALIHDWSEAYFNDIASPVKKRMPEYKKDELAAQHVIFNRMGVDFKLLHELEPYDKRICANEMRDLFNPAFIHYLEPLSDVIISTNDVNWRSVRSQLAHLTYREFEFIVLSDFARFHKRLK